jgi:hypothetical protein
MAVVRKGSLSLDAKRAILIDWAWTVSDRSGNQHSNVATLRRGATRCAITDFKSSRRERFRRPSPMPL